MMGWERRLLKMREQVSAEIFAYIMGEPVPQPVFLVFLPVSPDPARLGRFLWGRLGFARGLSELNEMQDQGWILANPRGIRGDKTKDQIVDFVRIATANASIIGDDH